MNQVQIHLRECEQTTNFYIFFSFEFNSLPSRQFFITSSPVSRASRMRNGIAWLWNESSCTSEEIDKNRIVVFGAQSTACRLCEKVRRAQHNVGEKWAETKNQNRVKGEKWRKITMMMGKRSCSEQFLPLKFTIFCQRNWRNLKLRLFSHTPELHLSDSIFCSHPQQKIVFHFSLSARCRLFSAVFFGCLTGAIKFSAKLEIS